MHMQAYVEGFSNLISKTASLYTDRSSDAYLPVALDPLVVLQNFLRNRNKMKLEIILVVVDIQTGIDLHLYQAG